MASDKIKNVIHRRNHIMNSTEIIFYMHVAKISTGSGAPSLKLNAIIIIITLGYEWYSNTKVLC